MNSTAAISYKALATRVTAGVRALERALKSKEAAHLKARATEAAVSALNHAETVSRAVADAIFREHIMKAITLTFALLVIAIAIPALY